MTTEVILHYRPYESETTQLPKIAEKAIQDFPTRPLSRFIPWFPHDGSRLPLKPKRLPPVISKEATEDVRQYFTISEHDIKLQSYDCTVDLLEFQPNLKKKKHLIRSHTLNEQTNSGSLDKQSEKGKQHKKRSWSVSLPSRNCTENIFPLSEKLQDSLKALNLHSFYRARWTIEHTICNNQTLEDIWAKLNRIIRCNELPSCNATIQRHLGQIWVFCDVMYCEYVGSLLKGRLALTGKINLFVHKHGVIFSM
ncbi:shieldin complex subunit 3 [Physeter macrocephalus]|uniref:Shieldin complex subunit 3 n=1 Tax=Physeter macrocephalus TaxID=9755 RepID=A0A2Y9EJM6_PHYMC|nr:shieldin complex subunit 3 [Physeter catodon]XP_028348741.1 shieldin complex subunit 3 [Physeter catodon]|eukprot:XP_007103370.1 shieldin complex subunit 3 [Physeter catodon]